VSSVRRDLERASNRFVIDAAGDDLVRILSQLTRQVERFDSMIRHQRGLLRQHGAHPAAFDDRIVRLKARRISAGATEIVTHARTALDQLRDLESGEMEFPGAESRQDS
jgi:hypothetical protein